MTGRAIFGKIPLRRLRDVVSITYYYYEVYKTMSTEIKATEATDSAVISDKPAFLYSLQAINNVANERYVMVFDATSVPANGAIPVWRGVLPASAQLNLSWFGNDHANFAGAPFKNGIAVAVSSTKASLTITSADEAYFNAHYSVRLRGRG